MLGSFYHSRLQLASPLTHMLWSLAEIQPSEQCSEFVNLPLGFDVTLVIRSEIHFEK